jgi:hypothetical protein
VLQLVNAGAVQTVSGIRTGALMASVGAGADLRDEPHMRETEMGRIREGFNSLGDSMYGVFAGIVDAEKKRNPPANGMVKYHGGWWDEYGMFLMNALSRCVDVLYLWRNGYCTSSCLILVTWCHDA